MLPFDDDCCCDSKLGDARLTDLSFDLDLVLFGCVLGVKGWLEICSLRFFVLFCFILSDFFVVQQ